MTETKNKEKVINIKVSWIKYEKDKSSFKMPEALGLDVYKLKDPEETDETIKKLLEQNYKTIVLSNEIAGFSEDIIKKYNYNKNVNIIIAHSKE